jgi:hypothetical protein
MPTYRVIHRIDDKARVVTVADVAHRRDAYPTYTFQAGHAGSIPVIRSQRLFGRA